MTADHVSVSAASRHEVINDLPSGASRQVDVAIVGGGVSGSLAAVALGRAGLRVALIDAHATFPAEFRCEKLDRGQVRLLRELDLFDCLAEVGTHTQQMHVVRSGRLVDRLNVDEHGFFYQDFVNAVRKRLPPQADLVVGRVTDLLTGPDRQRVVLANGSSVEARLIVLACGLSDALRQPLGIVRRAIRDRHSMTVGFSIAPQSGASFEFPALTYYGDRVGERIGYICFFPIKDTMRVNLFCFRGADAAWVHLIRDEPHKALFQAMPGLRRFVGDFQLTAKVQARVADLYRAESHIRDGVVLIGDAFQTTCPAAGNGLTRVLTDVGRLCNVHAPNWLATAGMPATKIQEFYQDPVKQACDEFCSREAEYARSFATDRRLAWGARRLKAVWRPQISRWKDNLGLLGRPAVLTGAE